MYTHESFVLQRQSEQKFLFFSERSDVGRLAFLPVCPIGGDQLEPQGTVKAILLLAVVQMELATHEQMVEILAGELGMAIFPVEGKLRLNRPVVGTRQVEPSIVRRRHVLSEFRSSKTGMTEGSLCTW